MPASSLSPSFGRSFIGWRFRMLSGRCLYERFPPSQGRSTLFSRFCREAEVRHGVREFGPADQRRGAARRHPVQGWLNGEDASQLTADPPRNGYGLAELFQESGACGIQRLHVGNAVTMPCKRLRLQARTEECSEKERCRRGQPASVEPIEALQVRVQYRQVVAVSQEPSTELRKERRKEPAPLQEGEDRPSGSEEEDFQHFFVKPWR